MAGAVRLAVCRALVAPGADQVVRLLREQRVKRVLDGFSYEFGQVGLYRALVD